MKGVNIDEVINKATRQAIKEYDKEKKIKEKKKIFHNTKLLLKHYNDLKSHLERAIDDIYKLQENELVDSDFIDMSKSYDELYILSLKKSKTKTLIMVSHIDMALDSLQKKQIKLCSVEKYLALEKYYINEKTFEEIAEELSCGVATVRRWVNEMINELSILLFGIDGLKLDMVR